MHTGVRANTEVKKMLRSFVELDSDDYPLAVLAFCHDKNRGSVFEKYGLDCCKRRAEVPLVAVSENTSGLYVSEVGVKTTLVVLLRAERKVH